MTSKRTGSSSSFSYGSSEATVLRFFNAWQVWASAFLVHRRCHRV